MLNSLFTNSLIIIAYDYKLLELFIPLLFLAASAALFFALTLILLSLVFLLLIRSMSFLHMYTKYRESGSSDVLYFYRIEVYWCVGK